MASAKPTPPANGGAQPARDYADAKARYFGTLKKNAAEIGELAQEMSEEFKFIKKVLGLQPAAFRAATKVFEMEDAKRDDWLRTFNGTLREFGIDPDPKDMFGADSAQPKAKPKPKLVTVPHGGFDDAPAGALGDTDLAEEVDA